jgi:hypothetical protein
MKRLICVRPPKFLESSRHCLGHLALLGAVLEAG